MTAAAADKKKLPLHWKMGIGFAIGLVLGLIVHALGGAEVRGLLEHAPGIRLVDRVADNYFPMPRDASGQDDILAGRIRQDLSDPTGHSIAMFVSGDQLLKGAALNAVQIAERLLEARPLGETRKASAVSL